VIELRSDTGRLSMLKDKMREYIDNGAQREMKNQRIPLISLLNEIEVEAAKLLIIVIARSAILGVKEGTLSSADCERLIFNLDILTYCGKHIQDKRLYKLISYGMELGDIERLVSSPEALINACIEMEGILSEIMAR